MNLFLFSVLMAIFTSLSCSRGGDEISLSLSPCLNFQPARNIGNVESKEIVEASGLVASRRHPGVFWLHNDSGDGPRLFAINEKGRLLAIVTLKGAEAEDWEDLALGPGTETGRDFLYIGDIGSGGHPPVTIYRLLEPDVDQDQTLVTLETTGFEKISLTYPDGADPDAETLFVDPLTSDLFLVTKTGKVSELFRKKAPHITQEKVWEKVGEIDFSSLPGNHQATGGDITLDGRYVVIRTYTHAFVWPTKDLALSPPCFSLLLNEEPQGEAIAFTPEGDLVTISEGKNQPLYLYEQSR